MDGYGGRAGSFQFDERVIDGVRSEDVDKLIEARFKKWLDSIPTHRCEDA